MKEAIFITGVSRGLGYSLARHFLEGGHTVYGCSRSSCDLEQAFPDSFHHSRIDLQDSVDGPARMMGWLKGVPGFDRAILNAGILPEIRDMQDTPLESMKKTMQINVWANKWILDSLLGMPEKPRQVVAISSGAAVSGSRGWNGYSMSKAALNMLIKLYAAEEPNVHFTSLAPGLIDTAMQDYICGIEEDEQYETVQRLKSARNTPDMPTAEDAGNQIAGILDKLLDGSSGDFVDIRKMEK